MSKFLNFLKKNKWFIVVFVISFISGLYFLSSLPSKDSQIKTIRVTREDIKETVEVSGSVEAAQSSNLSFEKSGVVQSVNVKVGDKVRSGQALAYLSGSDTYSAIREAEAGVQSAQANLNSVKSGAAAGDIDIRKQNLENAKADLQNAQSSLTDTYNNINNSVRDIMSYRLSDFFTKDTGSYSISFINCDAVLKRQVENSRQAFDNVNVDSLDSAKIQVDNLNAFINQVNDLVSAPCFSSDPSLSSKKSTISTIKSQIQAMYSDISSKRSLILSSTNAVARAEKDLNAFVAPVDYNKIAIAEASLNQAYSRLASARAQAGKNVLLAPFSGTVTVVNIKRGELSPMSQPAISIISDSKYQVKSKVSEADIAKLSIGNTAKVDIGAFPDKVFEAKLTQIDPASTNEGGVPRYGVVLSFNEKSEELKVGLTANAKIETGTKVGALVLPSSYVSIKSGGGLVKVKTSTTTEERIVELGVRSKDGKVEIVKGLSEGDEIIETK